MKKIFLATLSILCITMGMFLKPLSAQAVPKALVRFDNETSSTPDKNWHYNGSDDFAVQFRVAEGSFSGGCVHISMPVDDRGAPSWNLPVKLYQWQTNVFETKKSAPIAETAIAVTQVSSLYEFDFAQDFQAGEYLIEISVPESVNWYADVLFNQAEGLKADFSGKVQYYRGMNSVDTKYVFGLFGSALSFETISEQSNAPAGRVFFAGGNKTENFGSPFAINSINNWGVQFNTTGKFVSAGMYIYSGPGGVNAKLYKWAYNYETTVAAAPVEDITLQCAADGWKTFQFSKEYEAGEYLLVVSGTDAGLVAIAGEDKVDSTKVVCYQNGALADKISIGYITISSAAGELVPASASVENPAMVRFDNSASNGEPDKNWHYNGSDDFAVQFHVADGSFNGGCVYISLPIGNGDGIYAGGFPSWNLPVKLYQWQTNVFETKKNAPIAETVIAMTNGAGLYGFTFDQVLQAGEYLIEISVPESVNWSADVLFNQAEANADINVQYYRGLKSVETKYVFGLSGSDLSFGTISEQSNAPAGRVFFAGGNKTENFGSPFAVNSINNWGVQFNTTGKFVSAGMFIYSGPGGVNAKLYKWAGNYENTVAAAPVEDVTLQCAADGWKTFQFSKEYEAGEYLLVVSGTDAGLVAIAGEDKDDSTKVVCYQNGALADKTSIGYITISSAAGELVPVSTSPVNPAMVRFDNESSNTPDKNWHYNGSDDFAVQFHVAEGSFSGGCVHISMPVDGQPLPSWNLPVKLYQWQTNVFETKKNAPIAETVIAMTNGAGLYEFDFAQDFQAGEYLIEISVPESVNWYADVLFNQAEGLKADFSGKVQYYRGMNSVDTKYVFGLYGSALSFETISEQSNAPAGRVFFAGGNKTENFGSPFAIGASNWGVQFNTTGKFVSAGMFIYSPNENSEVNAKLYKWAGNYENTVAAAPVEDITLQCAADGWKTFQFSKEYEAGEYLLVVSGTGFVAIAGEDKDDSTKVVCYQNGELAEKTAIGYITISSAAGELVPVSTSPVNPGTGESGSYALFIMVSLIACTFIFFRKKSYNK